MGARRTAVAVGKAAEMTLGAVKRRRIKCLTFIGIENPNPCTSTSNLYLSSLKQP